MDIPIYPIFAPSVLHSIPFSVLQMPIFIVDYHFCLAISTLLDGHSAGLIILLSWFYHLCLLAKSNALVTMSPLVAMFSVAYIAVSRWPNHMFTCFLSKYNFLDMKLPKITLWSLCCSCLHPHHISSSRGRENSLKQVIKTHVPSFWGYQFWLAISPFMIAIHLAIKPTKKWFLKDRLLYISPGYILYISPYFSPWMPEFSPAFVAPAIVKASPSPSWRRRSNCCDSAETWSRFCTSSSNWRVNFTILPRSFDQDSGRGKNRGEILVLLGDDI